MGLDLEGKVLFPHARKQLLKQRSAIRENFFANKSYDNAWCGGRLFVSFGAVAGHIVVGSSKFWVVKIILMENDVQAVISVF